MKRRNLLSDGLCTAFKTFAASSCIDERAENNLNLFFILWRSQPLSLRVEPSNLNLYKRLFHLFSKGFCQTNRLAKVKVGVSLAIVEDSDELKQISLSDIARASWILQHVDDRTHQLIILVCLFLS